MFDLLDRPKVWIPIHIPVLRPGGEEAGAVATVDNVRVDLYVELVDNDEAVRLFSEASDDRDLNGAAFRRLVSNWRGVKVGGSDAPFDEHHIAMMLQYPTFPAAFALGYIAAHNGKVKLREGN